MIKAHDTDAIVFIIEVNKDGRGELEHIVAGGKASQTRSPLHRAALIEHHDGSDSRSGDGVGGKGNEPFVARLC